MGFSFLFAPHRDGLLLGLSRMSDHVSSASPPAATGASREKRQREARNTTAGRGGALISAVTAATRMVEHGPPGPHAAPPAKRRRQGRCCVLGALAFVFSLWRERLDDAGDTSSSAAQGASAFRLFAFSPSDLCFSLFLASKAGSAAQAVMSRTGSPRKGRWVGRNSLTLV